MTKRIDDLVIGICGTPDHPLAPLLRQWCAESRGFLGFAEGHASKIRKKARLAALNGTLADLCAELAIAALLAADRRFALRYEPLHAGGQRSPDFAARFRSHTLLYVEVTRLRLTAGGDPGAPLRLARTICDKIGQLPPGAMNLLVIATPPGAADAALPPAAILLLDRAPQPEAAPELRPADVREFQRLRPQLSAIALCPFADDWRPLAAQLWQNPQAKHPLLPEIVRVVTQAGAA